MRRELDLRNLRVGRVIRKSGKTVNSSQTPFKTLASHSATAHVTTGQHTIAAEQPTKGLHKAKRAARGSPFRQLAKRVPELLFANHRNGDGSEHVGVQRNFELDLTDLLERAVGHADGGAVDVEALGNQAFGNVGIANRAEQASVHAGLAGDLDVTPSSLPASSCAATSFSA
jgi:hypothetical protein